MNYAHKNFLHWRSIGGQHFITIYAACINIHSIGFVNYALRYEYDKLPEPLGL
jgi:hypothetical protein